MRPSRMLGGLIASTARHNAVSDSSGRRVSAPVRSLAARLCDSRDEDVGMVETVLSGVSCLGGTMDTITITADDGADVDVLVWRPEAA